ncbi:hypothetical protein AXX17_ATUG03370 [Arabidopsis thaliana]|uniref:Uncharacterized protein n=1 Tax=Arabidopsis thaliana TaxID=3702 RepID=A0A178U6D8_ARATH|nr:hypothetical protein AXX17_ATUG03370 [Arabidopsis thaliana]
MMRLSPDLTEAAIQGLTAVADRESARGFERRLADVGRSTERLEGEAQRLRRERDALAESCGRHSRSPGTRKVSANEDQAAESLFLPGNREALLQAWHAFEDAYREVESARKQANWAEADEAMLDRAAGAGPSATSAGRSRGRRASNSHRSIRYTVPVLAGAGTLGAAIAAAMHQGQTALPYSLLAAALAILTGASLLRIYRPAAESTNSGADQLARAAFERSRSAWAELDRRLAQASAALGRLLANPETAAASLLSAPDEGTAAESEQARKSLRDAVYSHLAKEAEQDRAAVASLELRSRMEQAERESARVEQELSESKNLLIAVRDQWKEWLTLRSLPPELEPASLPEFIQLAEQALQLLRQRSRLEERSAAIAAQLAAFEAEAAGWLLLHPHPLDAQADSVTALKQLYREALAQKETAAEARRQDEHVKAAEASVAAARTHLADAEAAVAEPMLAGGPADEAAYAARIVIDARRLALRQEMREAELRLEAGRDETTRQELFKLLNEHDASALTALLEKARTELARLEAEQAERLDRRGRLAQELSRLRSEAEIEDRAFALGERQAELDRLADRYTMLALTAELIRQTRSSFEEERQPDVLRLASDYFGTMTGGRYRRIMAPQDTQTLLAEDQEKRIIESAYLSRGTQEQLYLSLRLALAGAASAGTPLPLLLDDLFVHFDAQRLERGIDVLEEASRVRQTIFFTCHEHIARLVKERLPGAGIIRVPL